MIRNRLQVVFLIATCLVWAHSGEGGQWYVGPGGKTENTGTQEAPWDIGSALAGGHPVQPGDTVFLLPGTYRRRPDEQFAVRLTGNKSHPIHVRPMAGQRVTIDGGLAIHDPSAHVWIWDLEILVSEPDTSKEKPVTAGSHPEDFQSSLGRLEHLRRQRLQVHPSRDPRLPAGRELLERSEGQRTARLHHLRQRLDGHRPRPRSRDLHAESGRSKDHLRLHHDARPVVHDARLRVEPRLRPVSILHLAETAESLQSVVVRPENPMALHAGNLPTLDPPLPPPTVGLFCQAQLLG